MEIGGIVMFKNEAKDILELEKKEEAEEKILETAIKETAKVANNMEYCVTCARLNVRSGASDTSSIISTIGSGDKITVDKSRAVGAWSKVVKPLDGYVMTKFIAPIK